MTIIYRDEMGVVCQEIENDNDCSISFLDGKAYFTSNGIDFKIEVSSIMRITSVPCFQKSLRRGI